MTEQLFWSKVDKTLGPAHCWPWIGAKNKRGYGVTSINWKQVTAHRLAFFYNSGQSIDGLCVCHRCDNPPCCNPEHLFLGTNADNTRDRDEKGRQSHGESHSQAVLPNRPRGESHYEAKITEAQVIEIRRCYVETNETLQSMADRFGLSYHALEKVATGQTWKHLPIPEKRSGARHAKYDQARVEEIRSLRKSGMTVKAIAAHFGMSIWTCNDIVYQRTRRA